VGALRRYTARGRPLGSDSFVSKIETLLGRRVRPLCLPKTPSGAETAGISVTMKGNRGFWPA
jgi:hypothetical protein